MAELKRTEQALDDIVDAYQGLVAGSAVDNPNEQLQHLSSWPSIVPRRVQEEPVEKKPTITASLSLTDIVQLLTSWKQTLTALEPTIQRFRQRLSAVDPVTQQPRYGAQTQQRVQAVLTTYESLCQALHINNNDDNDNDDEATTWVHKLQEQHRQQVQSQQEQERLQQQVLQEQEQQRRLEQEAMEKEALEQQRMQELQAQEEQQRAEEALRQQAQEARERRLAQEAADRQWAASIPKTKESIREQLDILKKELGPINEEEYKTAITSLFRIFQQIQAHPEETKYRRIRRDHEQFHKDIGRHVGGREVLLAAGFELGAIDDVPCYLSKEPDLETDMDAWTAWYDLQKGAFEILQEEFNSLQTNKRR